MHVRQVLIGFLSLMLAVLLGWAAWASVRATPAPLIYRAQLENVRDIAPATVAGAPDYAIDGGLLFVGTPGFWQQLALPEGVIAGAVDVVVYPKHASAPGYTSIYVGAANELAVYRSDDAGKNWLRGSLTHPVVHGDLVGGVTDLAVDPVQMLVYVGTDTAGLFRVRDTGSRLISTAHLLLKEPVRQVVTDRTGSGMVLARTEWKLYHAHAFGLHWDEVTNLLSLPTAVAIGLGPIAYVGTVDRGVLRSYDGEEWTPANRGLLITAAPRLHVDALAVDPIQTDVLYVAVSQLEGEQHAHHTPSRVAQSRNGGEQWLDLDAASLDARVTDLVPVSGSARGVYALTLRSRTPHPLGDAPVIGARAATSPPPATPVSAREMLAWVLAGLAALALVFAVAADVATQSPRSADPLATQPEPIRRPQ